MKDKFPDPRLYQEFATWWYLLSKPEDYAEEATFFFHTLLKFSPSSPETLLELGSGGGNNASHLKHYFHLTLVDLSEDMLQMSKGLNPECEHIQGDMRDVRLDRKFDAVFVHDAVMYITKEDDLKKVLRTAYIHCEPGGVALFVPDHVKETFSPSTKRGGHDGEARKMRYLAWNWDPDPEDSTYVSDFVYLLLNMNGEVRCEYDRHQLGLFSRDTWLGMLETTGFNARMIPFEHSELASGTCEMFLGVKKTIDEI
jgi:SAM-dependent methyltransferase